MGLDFDKLVERIHQYRYRPKTEEDWLAADDSGFTIAHYLANGQVFPVDFPYWSVSDRVGWTVAHVAASQNKLPEAFSHWGLSDVKGDSVAHIVARAGRLPIDLHFNKSIYSLTNVNGESVRDILKAKVDERIKDIRNIIVEE